jgi:thymidylate synthase (FAD)
MDPVTVFNSWGGRSERDLPYFAPTTHMTVNKTPYLMTAGVIPVACSAPLLHIKPFLEGFDASTRFLEALADPTRLTPAATLSKLAGQLCYVSFGPSRTPNAAADAYFTNIKSSRHGSILEHATASFLLYGVSRSTTHELVRHRAGFAFSQVSQRYVGSNVLRFVERPEFHGNEQLHTAFTARIDYTMQQYKDLIYAMKHDHYITTKETSKTLTRKSVQQAARALLTNETEAPLLMSGNMRSWRHFIEQRASIHADKEIQQLAVRIYLCLVQLEPILFNDYTLLAVEDQVAIETTYTKI